MHFATLIRIGYLITAICFILALKGLSSPKRARVGNIVGALGMLLGVGLTFATKGIGNLGLMGIAMVVGLIIGVVSARKVKMTAMPQMVAAFNGVGGGAAALVAFSEFIARSNPKSFAIYQIVEVLLGITIGCISFAGSVLSFLKLQELMPTRPIVYKGQQAVNGLIGILIAAAIGFSLAQPSDKYLIALLVLGLIFGIGFVLPIGGADVPVLISLLNSFTGLAVAASGFAINSTLLVIAGTLVGASGTLLTRMMSEAMGRSLPNILFSAFGANVTAAASMDQGDKTIKSSSPEDVAILLNYANKVVFVPGYGLAVAQAQHIIKELADVLESKGIEVIYAIHPVAGRMPGHMNVLLAEANVPYEQLKELEDANRELSNADVALVVGANDVVNPAAHDTPGSPIYGMPIIHVDQAKSVVFMKRSMRPGFAGIDNSLLYYPQTTLLFGDAKESLTKLVQAVKSL
ncbi:MAG: NAD(P)(+) transhydrogenase (Re/Si-specific) subunit beta [Nitrososphaerota archaeon]